MPCPPEPDANREQLRTLIAQARDTSVHPAQRDKAEALLFTLGESLQQLIRQDRLRDEHEVEDVDRYHLEDLEQGNDHV